MSGGLCRLFLLLGERQAGPLLPKGSENSAQTRSFAHRPRRLLPEPRLDSGPCALDRTNLPKPPGRSSRADPAKRENKSSSPYSHSAKQRG